MDSFVPCGMKFIPLLALALTCTLVFSNCRTHTSGLGQYGDYRLTTFDAQRGPAQMGSATGSTAAAPTTPVVIPGKRPSQYAASDEIRRSIPKDFVVKTTAYTHKELDSLPYGKLNAEGTELKFGQIRSAAADWSRYPLGTRFKIQGLPYEYVVDDYGRALVGTDTIDLYKPDFAAMHQWGARDVGIEVLEWGSFEASRKILEERKHKKDAPHVREMLQEIDEKIEFIPEDLRNGFSA